MSTFPPFSPEDYAKARAALEAGASQLVPDGRSCAICGDDGHQAFSCNHNPLVQMKALEVVSGLVSDLHEGLHRAIERFPRP